MYENLTRCFPEKSDKEIDRIAKDFYRHFCDILVEGLKGFTLSKETLMKRLVINNVEKSLGAFYEKGINCIIAPAHYNNWEYPGLVGGQYLQHYGTILYKPISNPLIDRYFKKKRKQWNTDFWSIYDTQKLFEQTFERPHVVVMAADQNPGNVNKAHWVNFFDIDTAFLHGPDFYGRRNKMPVFYAEVRRLKRGHYEAEFILIADPTTETLAEGEITQRYAKKLASVIKENPPYWLWSHKRWKHKRWVNGCEEWIPG